MDTLRNTKKTIHGIITASDWDQNDEILGIKILSADEEEYHISDPDVMEELIDALQSEVEISGTVSVNADGEKVMHVETYEILSEIYGDDPEWDDDEEFIDDEDYHDPDTDIDLDMNEDYPEDDEDL